MDNIFCIDDFERHYFSSYSSFTEGYEYMRSIIATEAAGVTSGNIVSKFITIIIKAFKWLIEKIKRFMVWLKNLIGGKKKKTVDQIMNDIGVDQHKEISQANSGEDASIVKTSGGIKFRKVKIPSNRRSTIKMDDNIQVMLKPIIVEWDSLKETFGISINRADNEMNIVKDKKVSGHNRTRSANLYNIAAFAQSPKLRELFKAAITAIRMENNTLIIDDDFLNKHRTFNENFNGLSLSSQTVISYKELEEVQKMVNEIWAIIEPWANPSMTAKYTNKGVLNELNSLVGFVSSLQYSLNSFMAVMNEVFMIDLSYVESIKDLKTLDIFINEMINTGIPSKYIAYNAYMVTAKDIKGSKGNQNDPIWGQSRAVFFPDTDNSVVHKIALSGLGIASNKNEFNISKKFAETGGSYLLAPITNIQAKAAVCSAERVDTSNKVSNDVADNIKNTIDHHVRRHGISSTISDIHANNIGIKNGKPVVIDYGYLERIQ